MSPHICVPGPTHQFARGGYGAKPRDEPRGEEGRNILYHVAALAIMLVDPWMSLPFMAMAHGQSLSPAGEPYALSLSVRVPTG